MMSIFVFASWLVVNINVNSTAMQCCVSCSRTGVPYELVVLEGCAHGAWCYNGEGNCAADCPNNASGVDGYDPTMDTIALPFVAKQLGLEVL